MSYNITGTTITLTRGDTFEALVSATKRDGTQYIPVAGDTIRFAMKENYDDPRPLLVKDIPIDTMMRRSTPLLRATTVMQTRRSWTPCPVLPTRKSLLCALRSSVPKDCKSLGRV